MPPLLSDRSAVPIGSRVRWRAAQAALLCMQANNVSMKQEEVLNSECNPHNNLGVSTVPPKAKYRADKTK